MTVRTKPSRLLSLGNFRSKLSGENAPPQLALPAILVGVKTALVMILFRLFIEVGSDSLLGINRENFETLEIVIPFISSIAGPLMIGLLLFRLRADKREAGVAHVIAAVDAHLLPLAVDFGQGQVPQHLGAILLGTNLEVLALKTGHDFQILD